MPTTGWSPRRWHSVLPSTADQVSWRVRAGRAPYRARKKQRGFTPRAWVPGSGQTPAATRCALPTDLAVAVRGPPRWRTKWRTSRWQAMRPPATGANPPSTADPQGLVVHLVGRAVPGRPVTGHTASPLSRWLGREGVAAAAAAPARCRPADPGRGARSGLSRRLPVALRASP